MGESRDADVLERWLRDKPPEFACILAARAALRVVPALAGSGRFVRLTDPDRHREAITSRPLLLHGVARQTRLTVTSHHGRREAVAAALRRIASFFRALARSAEQLSDEDRWRRILAEALRKYLHGREPGWQPWLPPPRAAPVR